MKERRTYYCNHCKHPLDSDSDIVRFHRNAVYHLDCYVQHINKDKDFDSFPCPKCHTTGKFWNRNVKEWIKCKLCSGRGYLVINNDSDDDEIIFRDDDE